MLPESARSVLRLLAADGPATRPMLAKRLDLSKPTMSAAMTTLTSQELVITRGEASGPTGRSAQVYALGPLTGYAIGLDLGSTQVRVLASRLDGETLCEMQESVPQGPRAGRSPSAMVAAELLEEIVKKLGASHGHPRTAAAALPRVIRPTGSPERDDDALRILEAALPQGVSLRLENNANCAAMAEQAHGAAAGHESFVYLQAGVKIGLGIVANNQLLRGVKGGAGEVSHLSFPWASQSKPRRGELERHLGSAALVRRARRDWPTTSGRAPRDAAELFALARAGDEAARRHVQTHATDLGYLVSSIVSVLDPSLVVLGGGVGQNAELLPEIRRTVARLAWPSDVEISALGQDATLLGAVSIATEEGLNDLLANGMH